ncbi:MAG: HD domain-containing protein [Dehalococcoidia bacterium]|nr:HD domain-containing protein [Dehalococcoidia bacterium]
MDREETMASVKASVDNDNLVKHMLATEAIMRALARRLSEDEDEWGLVGLVHDIDVELTEHDPRSHSKLGADLAKELGASETMCHAVLCHNEAHGVPCDTLISQALFCTDPLTGLVTAAALVRPDKSLSGVTAESLMKRFKEKRFAAGAKRENIAACEQIGTGLEEFVGLGLEAMKDIAPELGL